MIRYKIIFKGTVQGVGFRYVAMRIAKKTGVTGFAKNLSNGDVEVEIQGENHEIDAFLKEIMLPHPGPMNIEDYAIKKIQTKMFESDFEAIYY